MPEPRHRDDDRWPSDRYNRASAAPIRFYPSGGAGSTPRLKTVAQILVLPGVQSVLDTVGHPSQAPERSKEQTLPKEPNHERLEAQHEAELCVSRGSNGSLVLLSGASSAAIGASRSSDDTRSVRASLLQSSLGPT